MREVAPPRPCRAFAEVKVKFDWYVAYREEFANLFAVMRDYLASLHDWRSSECEVYLERVDL
jgi:hypothetical protein